MRFNKAYFNDAAVSENTIVDSALNLQRTICGPSISQALKPSLSPSSVYEQFYAINLTSQLSNPRLKFLQRLRIQGYRTSRPGCLLNFKVSIEKS